MTEGTERPFRHSRRVQSPFLSFPTFLIGNPWPFPMQGHPNEGTEKKNPGFPLTTGGNDKGGPASMTEGRTGMTEGAKQVCQRGQSGPFRHARRVQSPLLSFPTFFIGNPWLFPMQGHPNEGTEEKNPGFPLTTGGNDRGGTRGHDGGQRGYDKGDRTGPSVIPDVFNRPFCHSRHF